MVNNSPISTKQTITSKQWWSAIHQYQQNKQSPLNSDGQQFYQYQQNKQSPLNSDGQQFNQYQQNEQSPLNSDGQQFTNINKTNNHL